MKNDAKFDQYTIRDITLGIVGVVSVCGYVIEYSRSGSIQPWYSSNLMVPIFLVLVVVAKFIERMNNKFPITVMVISVMILVIVIYNNKSIHILVKFKPPWPHQQVMLEAGKFINQNPQYGRVGSWNAGIIGYYQGGTVVNIDGLVNDDIYGYVISNTLPYYLLNKDIEYIIDFENMIEQRIRRRKGGYDDEDFIDRLQPVKIFDQNKYGWKHLTLYRILP